MITTIIRKETQPRRSVQQFLVIDNMLAEETRYSNEQHKPHLFSFEYKHILTLQRCEGSVLYKTYSIYNLFLEYKKSWIND